MNCKPSQQIRENGKSMFKRAPVEIMRGTRSCMGLGRKQCPYKAWDQKKQTGDYGWDKVMHGTGQETMPLQSLDPKSRPEIMHGTGQETMPSQSLDSKADRRSCVGHDHAWDWAGNNALTKFGIKNQTGDH
jgi:hypothetical protein